MHAIDVMSRTPVLHNTLGSGAADLATPTVPAGHTAPTRLLLVEDNPGDAYLVRELLATAPAGRFEVRHVIRCAEAEQRAGDADVILLDLSLPDAQGLEAVARLRAAAPAVPIVIMSGNTDDAVALAGVRAGAQDYLPKGRVDGDLLVRTVRYAIERRHVEAQLAQAQAAELALREANRRMEEFLSIAGHELRTPLTSVLGNVQLAVQWADQLGQAEDEAAASARLAQLTMVLRRTERQGRVLTRLVNDLLDTARIQAGRLALCAEPANLVPLVREVVQEHRQQAPQRTIELSVPTSEDVCACIDAERLVQVLTNFLSNALKYSAADQPVTVGLHTEGAWARVWVRDRGPGLPAGEQTRVWERFYRVPGLGHQDGSSVGLGLGLYISRSIVEGHGGRVGVASTPGEGSTFWFTVPLARQGTGPARTTNSDHRRVEEERQT